MTSNTTDDKPEHPSLIGGHAKYIQGTISSALGYDSGESTKQSAVNEMRRATDTGSGSGSLSTSSSDESDAAPQEPMKSNILGTVEKALGSLTGCDGMVEEGEARMTGAAKTGSDELNGTG